MNNANYNVPQLPNHITNFLQKCTFKEKLIYYMFKVLNYPLSHKTLQKIAFSKEIENLQFLFKFPTFAKLIS